MSKLRLVAVVALTFGVATPLVGQEPQLGSLEFPTSAGQEAQALFERGVLFMHSFEYESAAEAFREAQAVEPGFAMAYWGEAMTYNHPIWNERDRDGAIAVLERLGPTAADRRAKAPTEREKMFVDAIEALWVDGPKAGRDTAYAEAMEDMLRMFPDDPEVRAFYALSLMGLSQGVRVVPTYVRAGAIALQLRAERPNHPGAAHYVIHAFDDPTHAPIALPAARAYSTIAPDAAHAQHMTTHIFTAMGMWDDVISQNIVAANLTNWGPGHYTSWLTYGLVQAGRFEDAETYLVQAHDIMQRDPRRGRRSYLATMRAHHVINTGDWDHTSLAWQWDLDGIWPVSIAADAFLRGYAAVKRGDRRAAEAARADLEMLTMPPEDEAKLEVMARELDAVLLLDAGKTEAGVTMLEEAAAMEAAMPVEFGPPMIVKPSFELLGEVLLDLERPADAQRAYEQALALTPRRALSLMGLVQASSSAGDEKTAMRARATLHEIWHAADRGMGHTDEPARLSEQ